MHLKQNKIPLKTIKEATQLTKVLLIRIASVLKHTRFFDICVFWVGMLFTSPLYCIYGFPSNFPNTFKSGRPETLNSPYVWL